MDKGVKAWRDRRVGYWLCIDVERTVLTRDWKVKLGPHVIGRHLDTSAYIVELRKAIKKRLSL